VKCSSAAFQGQPRTQPLI